MYIGGDGGLFLAKILGLSENSLSALGGLLITLFIFGAFSAYLSYSSGESSDGNTVLSACIVVALAPGIIFIAMAWKLAIQRNELGRLSLFLRQKVRASTMEVAQEFGWSEMEAEDKIVEAINEEHIKGHFDRGTRLFYVAGGQEHMAFVGKCRSCGADAGIWVTAIRVGMSISTHPLQTTNK